MKDVPFGIFAGLMGLLLLAGGTIFEQWKENGLLLEDRKSWYHESYEVYGDRNRLLNENARLKAENERLTWLTKALAERIANEVSE